jgi:hypothetical protein
VSVTAASILGGLPLRSPALDLLQSGATPSTAGTPWRSPSSSIFFYCCGGVVGVPQPDLLSLCPDLLPLPCRYFFFSQLRRSFAPMTTEVKSTPNPRSLFGGNDGRVFFILVAVHYLFVYS